MKSSTRSLLSKPQESARGTDSTISVVAAAVCTVEEDHPMKKVLLSLTIASVLAGSPALAIASRKAIEGRIQSVDPSGKIVTLINGPTFTVAPNVSTVQLKPGYAVTVFYEDENGVKVAFAFFIDAGPSRR